MPIIVGADNRQHQLLVLALDELLAGKTRQSREIERHQRAVGIHIIDTAIDVPSALADIAIAGRLVAELLALSSGARGRPDTAPGLAFDDPTLIAIGILCDARRLVLVLGG